jgi:hypothetical protein
VAPIVFFLEAGDLGVNASHDENRNRSKEQHPLKP